MNATSFQYALPFRRAQLEGILNDCTEIYYKITSSEKEVENNENKIRDRIAEKLTDDEYKVNETKFVKDYHVDTEAREGNNGRTDIRFTPINPYRGQKEYFSIECKRLDGKSHLCNEYVTNGINRYRSKKYESPLGFNAMMGFIVKKQKVEQTYRTINNNLPQEENLTCKIEGATKGCFLFESKHLYGSITLLHLWMDFSNYIIKK